MTDLEIAHQQDIAPWDLKVDELSDFHVAVFQDRFPVTPGHLCFKDISVKNISFKMAEGKNGRRN